jgi:hypothetical protein
LLEDDQTGSFQSQAGELGEYLQLLTEVLVYGKLASVSGMSYAGFSPSVSETQPSDEATWPWTSVSSPFVGGGFNKPTSPYALSQANVQDAIENQMQQKNKLGIVMPVNPNRLLISPKYKFDAAILLHSAYYPSGAAAAGNTGGAFAINPIQSILDITISRFMPDNNGKFANLSKAWYIVDDSRPWFQLMLRTPVEVVQEQPASGQSFERDVIRTKCRTRMNADFIEPRFAWQGSDGSI